MEKVRLGEIVEIRTGKLDANASDKNGKYPFFTCSKEPLKINQYSYDCECVLVAGNGDLNVKYYNGKFDAYQRTYIIEANNKKAINTKYLYYLVNSNIECLRRRAIGGVIKYIKLGDLKDIEVEPVDLMKQINIVKKLDKLEQIIKIRKKQIEKLDGLINSQFIEMFGDNEQGFKCEKIKFKECVNQILKGPFGSDMKKSLYVPKGKDTYKVYIQINAIQKNQDLGDYWISKKYYEQKMYKYKLQPKDYIVTCDGTLGKLLQLNKNMTKGVISSSLLKITLKEDMMLPLYFENIWHLYMLHQMKKNIRNACLTHLPSVKVIENMQIPLPSLEAQKRFTEFVEQINKQKSKIEANLKQIEELQASLMNKYF